MPKRMYGRAGWRAVGRKRVGVELAGWSGPRRIVRQPTGAGGLAGIRPSASTSRSSPSTSYSEQAWAEDGAAVEDDSTRCLPSQQPIGRSSFSASSSAVACNSDLALCSMYLGDHLHPPTLEHPSRGRQELMERSEERRVGK